MDVLFRRSNYLKARVFTRFLPLKSMGIKNFPDAQGQLTLQSLVRSGKITLVLGPIWLNFELIRDIMDVLFTCKYKEYPIKNKGARVDTTLYSNFSDAQGKITLVLVSVCG